MIALARIADRGPLTAAVLAAVLLLCALWVPILMMAGGGSAVLIFLGGSLSMVCLVASAAVVAFIALRHGELSALKVAGGCLLLLILVSSLLYGSAFHIPSVALIYWLPAIVAAFVLARTVRLDFAVLSIVAFGVIAVFAFFAIVGDTEQFLQAQFATAAGSVENSQAGTLALSEEQQQNLVASIARTIPGAFGVSVMIVALGALFLARSWQAKLVNPGGFQKEFHGLKLGRSACLAGVLVILLANLQGGQLAIAISMVIIFGLFLQGLAVAHALVKQRGMHRYWLQGLYVMIFLLPHTFLLLAALGLADNLFSLRGAEPKNS